MAQVTGRAAVALALPSIVKPTPGLRRTHTTLHVASAAAWLMWATTMEVALMEVFATATVAAPRGMEAEPAATATTGAAAAGVPESRDATDDILY